MTSGADRELLLALARRALTACVTSQTIPVSGAASTPCDVLSRLAGAFVSLHKQGQLRGCIGHVEADEPLARVVPRCAVAAATADPRFPPVAPDELCHISIELSLLGALESIATSVDVEVGRHGLVVEKGWNRGLLLPQVATEWNWDRERFIAETCRKAGLPPDAWTRGATLWRFEAEVFAE